MSAFESELRALIRAEVKDAVREALRSGDGWIDQHGSPLGRRHNAIVRKRVAAGLPGAVIAGRSHKLSRAALDEEIAALAKRAPRKAEPAPAADELAELREEYALRRVS